ncbi:hypothetical protein CHELA20_40110 [Hyphomicrobiales bacterium]|nr:hypothetical protein CHELA20_40110 [Hyphomicrobiales bacterium]
MTQGGTVVSPCIASDVGKLQEVSRTAGYVIGNASDAYAIVTALSSNTRIKESSQPIGIPFLNGRGPNERPL